MLSRIPEYDTFVGENYIVGRHQPPGTVSDTGAKDNVILGKSASLLTESTCPSEILRSGM
jgi:hypothetical protein